MNKRLFSTWKDLYSEAISHWDTDKQKVKELLQKSLKMQETADSRFALGNLNYELGKQHEAIGEWKKSLELEERADVHCNIGSTLALHGSREEAIGHFYKALELDPADGQSAFNCAATLESIGNLRDAVDMYQKAKDLGVKCDSHWRNAMSKYIGEKSGVSDTAV